VFTSLWQVCYESEKLGFILISFWPPQNFLKKGLLTRCSRNFDPIFDLIIIAKCNQWGFLRLRITVGCVGDGKNVYYKMYLGSITLMKTYPALFMAIGGRDKMDSGGVHQMICAIYRTHQPLVGALGSLLLFGCSLPCPIDSRWTPEDIISHGL
jgi:hypothetical protein